MDFGFEEEEERGRLSIIKKCPHKLKSVKDETNEIHRKCIINYLCSYFPLFEQTYNRPIYLHLHPSSRRRRRGEASWLLGFLGPA